MTATTRNAGHLDAQPDAALPGEQEVLDRAAGGELLGRLARARAPGARPPAGDLRLRAARRPDRRRGRRRPARAARPLRGRPRPRLRAASRSTRSCAALAPTVRELRPAARAVPAADRGEPARPGDRSRTQTFDELVDYCDAVGQPGRRARAARLRRRDARPDRALRPRLHRAAARRALAGRRRGLRGAAASTCRPRTWRRFGVADADLGAAATRRGAARADGVRGRRGRATLLDEGAPLVGTLRGRARIAVAGYVGGGRANARGDRARPATTCSPAPPRASSAAARRAQTLVTWRHGR